MKQFVPIFAALALAACGDTESVEHATENIAPAEPVTVATPIGAPEQGGDAGDSTRGEWTGKMLAGSPAALFGEPEADASFSVRCEGDELVFVRAASQPAGTTAMTLAAAGVTRRLEATSDPDPFPSVRATLPAKDPLAKALADADGNIAVTVGDGKDFLVPASDAFRTVVRDCAS